MVADVQKRRPLLLWAQRDNVLFLTVEVEDMKVDKLVCEGNKFLISGTNGSGKELYEAELELYAGVKGDELRRIETARQVELVIPKENVEWWPRLLKQTAKVPWLKVDFNKWVDEDEVGEDAGFDFSSMNFPSGDFGGNFGGLADYGDDADGKSDTDEEDLPPLDDVDPDKPSSSATNTEVSP